jgi:hypothetical protein
MLTVGSRDPLLTIHSTIITARQVTSLLGYAAPWPKKIGYACKYSRKLDKRE